METPKQSAVFSAKIEEGLQAHELIHAATNIRQSLDAANGGCLTETLAQNLVTGVFTHISKDELIIPEYIPLLKELGVKYPIVKIILKKSVTKRGRCPSVFRSAIRKLLDEIDSEFTERRSPEPTSSVKAPLKETNLISSPSAELQNDQSIDPTFNVNKLLGYDYNPLSSVGCVIPTAVKRYQASLSLLKRELQTSPEKAEGSSAVVFPKTLPALVSQLKQYHYRPQRETAKYLLRLVKRYCEPGREDLFRFALAEYCLVTGRLLYAANKRKESRSYFQTVLHLYQRSTLEVQGEFGWMLYSSLSHLFNSYNVYVPLREGAVSEVAEKFYANLSVAFLETGRQMQFQSLGDCLLDISLAHPWFLTDLINRLKTRDATSELVTIQKALMTRKVFLGEPLLCLGLLSRIKMSNVSAVLSRTPLSTADDRRAVATALIRYSLDSSIPAPEILKGFAQHASSDTKTDLAFSILVESLTPNLLTRGKEVKSKLIAETFGLAPGTPSAEYFIARVAELADLFHQFSRSSDPNIKGRYGYSILETIRLTRKWSVERLSGDLGKDVIRFYRIVEGYVTTEQSKLIRDTNLEIHLASARVVHSLSNTRVTFEIRNMGEGTADGLELEVFPVQGVYDVEDRFRTYSIDILSDKKPVQREVFIRPSVNENESIELSAILRYNTLKEKNKFAELDEANRTVWLYSETQFVRVPQPYNIGEPATTWFYGRHNLLENMADNLHAGGEHDISMIVYGLKRAGKTSVVKRFIRTLESSGLRDNYVPIYADLLKDPRLQSVKNDAEFLYFFISIIYESLSSNTDARVSFDLYRFKQDFLKDPFETFAFLLEEILGKIAPRRLLIALDEFSTLQSKLVKNDDGTPTLSSSMFGFISNTMQSTNQLTFIFTGTYMLLDMMREHTFDLAKICTPYMVGFLDDSAARRLVVEPVKRDSERPDKGWIEYDPRVIDQIVTVTNRHPFLIQYLCMQLVNRMNQLKHNSVTLNDITSIIEEVVHKPMHAPTMHSLWNEFDVPQHKVLSIMAASRSHSSEEWVDIDEIVHTFTEFGDLSTVDDVLAICVSLSDAELLQKSTLGDSESYRITIPLYQMWLKQNKPPRSAFLN